jgi:hypothetical protein
VDVVERFVCVPRTGDLKAGMASIIDTSFFSVFGVLIRPRFFQKYVCGIVSKPPKPGFVSFGGMRLAGLSKTGLDFGQT